MSNATTRGAQVTDTRTPLNNSIRPQDTPGGEHHTLTIPNDPQVVACPKCGARRLEPCTGRRLRSMTVHAERADRWMRTVAAENEAARWIEYPEHETPEALADRRLSMAARYCAERAMTELWLRLHGLERAIVDLTACEPCAESEVMP